MKYRKILPFLACLLFTTATIDAVEFPPISDTERALTELPGQPEAPAVVLFEKAEVKLRDYPKEASSFLKVWVRVKILTEEGKSSYGEEEIGHSAYWRLKKVEGRTVLPDGRVIPVSEDAIFEERRSRSLKRFVTKVVFPAVEVGAILDYYYEIRWDDLAFLEPWVFHNRVPTLLSEITYIKPNNMGLVPWGVQAGPQPMQSASEKSTQGATIRIWIEDLPAVPNEDYSFPFSDLASRFMMVPKSVNVSGTSIPLMDSWRGTCELHADDYRDFQRKSRDSEKKAMELTRGLTDPHAKIAAVHAFVRDEIQNLASFSIGVSDEERADKVLEKRQGTQVEKALLLQSMLEGINVESDILWVADRTDGLIDLKVANPFWFDSLVLRIDDAGGHIYLDPNSRRAGYNHLPPYYEGTAALVFDKKKPEEITLPKSSHEDNRSLGKVDLEVDTEGRVRGVGQLVLTGQEAWQYLRWKDTPEETVEAWQQMLEGKYQGFDVSEVKVSEDLISQQIDLSWQLLQRQEEVLGDEVTISPAAPLGPMTQLFSLPPELRKTPVLLLFPFTEDLTTTVRWPEGWAVDLLPESSEHSGLVGAVRWHVELDEASRQATLHRHFERTEREFVGSDTYSALRALYAEGAKRDALGMVLVSE